MSEENIKYVDLVSSTRGNIVENIHQGVAVAMDSEGRVIKKMGRYYNRNFSTFCT